MKASLERGLNAELSDHVGYDRGDPDAAMFPNSTRWSIPGPDGFTVDPDIDESALPDATDVVDPYLASG